MAVERKTSGPFVGYPVTIVEQFKKYHAENPDVYRTFKRLAFQMLKSGREKYSAKVIYNVMRWNHDVDVNGKSAFKMPDQYHPIYARLLAHHHEEFKTFFEFREVRSRGIKSHEQKKRESQMEMDFT